MPLRQMSCLRDGFCRQKGQLCVTALVVQIIINNCCSFLRSNCHSVTAQSIRARASSVVTPSL